MDREYYVYILTNQERTVLYTGVTNDLVRRVYQHKTKAVPSFTARYNVNQLVYYAVFDDVLEAIGYEKRIKAGPRRKKMELIDGMNPRWRDLWSEIAPDVPLNGEIATPAEGRAPMTDA